MQGIDRPGSAAMNTEVLLKHLSIVNKIFTEQVKTADQKAAYIFSFLTAILIFWSADLKRGFSLIMSSTRRRDLDFDTAIPVCFVLHHYHRNAHRDATGPVEHRLLVLGRLAGRRGSASNSTVRTSPSW